MTIFDVKVDPFLQDLVSNLQCLPSMTLKIWGSRHTSNHARSEIWQRSEESHKMARVKNDDG